MLLITIKNRLPIIFFMILSVMCTANSAVADLNTPVTIGGPDFLITNPQGQISQAMTLSTKVDIEVNGLVTHTRVRQKFLNNSHGFVEGKYVFPLPDTASVDNMQIRIGSRVIKGMLKEKAEAKQIYQTAKKEGKRAALVSQQRPNLFKVAVTNIPAGEIIEIDMTYINNVAFDNGVYSLMFPMTLTPRFNPSEPIINKDADNVFNNPNFLINNPPANDIINPIELTLKLNPGFQASDISSPSHDIDIVNTGNNTRTIRFLDRFVPMDSDFRLHWQQGNTSLEPQLFVETIKTRQSHEYQHKEAASFNKESGDVEHYAMLMLTPTAPAFQQQALNKEVIYIIDTSGSMGGNSIRQARKALLKALDMMNTGDSFNIIEFNSYHSKLFGSSMEVSQQTLTRARQFVSSLNARGGTNMKPALLDALKASVDNRERMRQVVFITDGAVGNEDDLVRSIQQFLGASRLFSVAIGSAPNQHLFRQVSKYGKGTFIKIAKLEEVESKMQHLFAKISKPAMKNIEIIDNNGNILSIEPNAIPDVYFGEPLKVALKFRELSGSITVKGVMAGESFEQQLSLENNHNSPGISKLWARAKIESLTDKMLLRQSNPDLVKKEIIALSIQHNLLTKYTSFVAVDHDVVRQPHEKQQTSDISNLLPKGTQFPKTSLGILPLYFTSFVTFLLACLLASLLRYRRVAS